MKPCQAVALAFGWYLMVPPFEAPQTSFGEWHTVKVFDSANDCQAYRDQLVSEASERKKSNVTLTYETKSGGTEYLDASAAQCIASDDPRLKDRRER